MSTTITCPNCKHEFNVENAIAHRLEHQYEEKLTAELQKERENFSQREADINKQKEKLEEEKRNQENKLKELVNQEKEKMKLTLAEEIAEENQEAVKSMQEKISRQKTALSNAVKEKLDLEKKMEHLKDREEEIENEIQKKVLEETRKIKSETEKKEQAKHYLDLKQRDELIDTLKVQMTDLQRKANQGSMQSQGEILELEVERILAAAFPLDHIEEVKKGVNGADCNHHVRNNNGKLVGTIAYETKRTKTFSDNWIEKMKTDMRLHKAGLGVIVTETMPKDMDCFGMRDGIWICSFHEVRSLAGALRQTILKVSEINISNEGKGEKMQVLYNFLTSDEFKHQMQAIVRGFVNMKEQIETEKRSMKRQWKEREKQLELIIDGATDMYGSIKGIAGTAIGNIPELEMSPDLIE